MTRPCVTRPPEPRRSERHGRPTHPSNAFRTLYHQLPACAQLSAAPLADCTPHAPLSVTRRPSGRPPRVERLATRARGQGCERAAEHTPTTRHWHSGIRPCHQGASLGRSQRAACRSAHHPSLVHPIDPRRQRRPPLAAAPLADGHLHASSRGAPRGGRVHPRVQTLAQPAVAEGTHRASQGGNPVAIVARSIPPRCRRQAHAPVTQRTGSLSKYGESMRTLRPLLLPRIHRAVQPCVAEPTDGMPHAAESATSLRRVLLPRDKGAS